MRVYRSDRRLIQKLDCGLSAEEGTVHLLGSAEMPLSQASKLLLNDVLNKDFKMPLTVLRQR